MSGVAWLWRNYEGRIYVPDHWKLHFSPCCEYHRFRVHKRFDRNWFEWPRMGSAHSRKPEAFLDIVEATSPAPRLEMFARRQRLGWDTWGNEALEHVEIAS